MRYKHAYYVRNLSYFQEIFNAESGTSLALYFFLHCGNLDSVGASVVWYTEGDRDLGRGERIA